MMDASTGENDDLISGTDSRETGVADRYFNLLDLRSYIDTQFRVDEVFRKKGEWARMAIRQTACAGKFSSDRTIEEYVNDIWHLKKLEL